MPRVFELAVHATLLSQTVVTVHHFRAKSDSSGGTDAETLATDWRDNLKTAWLAGKSNNYTINRLSVRSVDPTPGDQVYEVFRRLARITATRPGDLLEVHSGRS